MPERYLETGTISYQEFVPSGAISVAPSQGDVYTSNDPTLAGVDFTFVGLASGNLQFVPAINGGTLAAGTLTRVSGSGDASIAYTSSDTSAPINVQTNVYWLGNCDTTNTKLLTDYDMQSPPGYPSRPSCTGTNVPQYPHTLQAGTTLTLLKVEADALIAAGAAVAV